MRQLPKVVAATAVGKSVELKIWRNKKLITKRLTLGRLESSKEFKEKKTTLPKKNKEVEVDSLKVTVRDLNSDDRKRRNLKSNQKGSVVVEISKRSPLLNLVSINDIIIEVQKSPVTSSENLKKMISDIISKGEQTVLLTIINNSNQRRYLGVKLK